MNLPRLLPLVLAGIIALSVRGADRNVTTITSNGPLNMASTDTETTFVWEDNVVVTSESILLTCDRLEAIVLRKGANASLMAESNNFKTLLATGHVHIVQGDREAFCGRAEVMPLENNVVLTEKPKVQDNGYKPEPVVWIAAKITMFKNQRRVIAESAPGEPVVITGPSLKDLGFDSKKELPAPSPKPNAPALK